MSVKRRIPDRDVVCRTCHSVEQSARDAATAHLASTAFSPTAWSNDYGSVRGRRGTQVAGFTKSVAARRRHGPGRQTPTVTLPEHRSGWTTRCVGEAGRVETPG